jgi:hypothetical protein
MSSLLVITAIVVPIMLAIVGTMVVVDVYLTRRLGQQDPAE